jgi:hypothetical protein
VTFLTHLWAIVRKELEHHMGPAESMMTHIKEEMRETDDEAMRILLQHLAEDERRRREISDAIMQKC